MVMVLAATLPACPAKLYDLHHLHFVPWSGMWETPGRETRMDTFEYTRGTPRCLYFHDYADEKGRPATHRLELRLRDGEIFHDAWTNRARSKR